ncbi:MAG TPA: DUF2127 domain-containing protein [Opitutaceae bacterium]|nr:DUF2127 domain-containing protein [Opitutaceae bacterium]
MIRKPLLTGVRLVGAFEAAKGALVLLAGMGLLSLIHRDVQAVAEHIIRFGHLNPASHYPKIFIDAASRMTNARLWSLAAAAALYAIVRFIEAYGLWHERLWAEWFALIASGLYLPVEIFELLHRPSWVKATVFAINVAIVAYMAYAVRHPEKQQQERQEGGPDAGT